jgi:hypothetical protein
VIDVEGPDVARVDRFTLRTADGELLEFAVRALSLSGGGKPAPHLREHQASGAPITVDYRLEDGERVAIRYYDAP